MSASNKTRTKFELYKNTLFKFDSVSGLKLLIARDKIWYNIQQDKKVMIIKEKRLISWEYNNSVELYR